MGRYIDRVVKNRNNTFIKNILQILKILFQKNLGFAF